MTEPNHPGIPAPAAQHSTMTHGCAALGEHMEPYTDYAVRNARYDTSDEAKVDYFPTPLWATRALTTHVITINAEDTVLEPACGGLHMVRALREKTAHISLMDLYPQDPRIPVGDFCEHTLPPASFDWVITNPPFSRAQEFILAALPLARKGVAMLARTNLLEGVGRHVQVFTPHPLTIYAPFVERVPMVKNRVDKKASTATATATATAYAWFVWLTAAQTQDASFAPKDTIVRAIPPCRKALELDTDYR